MNLSKVYVIDEDEGAVTMVTIPTTTVGAKRVGLMERHLVYACRQQIGRALADFTKDAACQRKAEALAAELGQIRAREVEIRRALELIGAMRRAES
jgi:hypothetical protein